MSRLAPFYDERLTCHHRSRIRVRHPQRMFRIASCSCGWCGPLRPARQGPGHSPRIRSSSVAKAKGVTEGLASPKMPGPRVLDTLRLKDTRSSPLTAAGIEYGLPYLPPDRPGPVRSSSGSESGFVSESAVLTECRAIIRAVTAKLCCHLILRARSQRIHRPPLNQEEQ